MMNGMKSVLIHSAMKKRIGIGKYLKKNTIAGSIYIIFEFTIYLHIYTVYNLYIYIYIKLCSLV